MDRNSRELKRKTASTMRLSLTPVSEYEGVPPTDVLSKMKEAKDCQIFDSFEIISVKRVPDPILVGKMEGTKDLFYIAEWDDDVSIDDFIN